MQRQHLFMGFALMFLWALALPVLAQPVYWSGNGHYYELVPAQGISWQQAHQAAQQRCYVGRQGHLATLSSAAEQAFVWSLIANCGSIGSQFYLGGYQKTPGSGDWRWVTGEPMDYTYWAPGEPNNLSYETVITIGLFCSGQWNNVPPDGSWGAAGYIVEYGGIAQSGDIDGNRCVDDADLLQVLFAFGTTGQHAADVNCDNVVDDADLLTVLFNFGRGC